MRVGSVVGGTLLMMLAWYGVTGCSGHSDTADPPLTEPIDQTGSGGTVTIYLEGGSAFPRMKTDVTFFANIDPRPHVAPLADAVAKASGSCNLNDLQEPAVMLLSLHGGGIRAQAKSKSATCLAQAIDGKPIDDHDAVTVELKLSPAAKKK